MKRLQCALGDHSWRVTRSTIPKGSNVRHVFYACEFCGTPGPSRMEPLDPQYAASIIRNHNTLIEDLPMCVHKGTSPQDNSIKANQVWYIEGTPYVVLQPLAKYLRADGEQTPYVVLREQGKEEVHLLTHKRFLQDATRTPKLEIRYITFKQIMANLPCWKGACELAYIMGVTGTDWSIQVEDFFALGRISGRSGGADDTIWSCQRLFDEYKEAFGVLPGHSYLAFVAEALKLIPKKDTLMDYDTLCRLLGIKR